MSVIVLNVFSPSAWSLSIVLLHQGKGWSHSPSLQDMTALPSIASVWSLHLATSCVAPGNCCPLVRGEMSEWPCLSSRSGGRWSSRHGYSNKESGKRLKNIRTSQQVLLNTKNQDQRKLVKWPRHVQEEGHVWVGCQLSERNFWRKRTNYLMLKLIIICNKAHPFWLVPRRITIVFLPGNNGNNDENWKKSMWSKTTPEKDWMQGKTITYLPNCPCPQHRPVLSIHPHDTLLYRTVTLHHQTAPDGYKYQRTITRRAWRMLIWIPGI